MRRVLVCGSRNWTDPDLIRCALCVLPPGSVVIHGAARGADSIAGQVARKLGLKVEEYPADWEAHGKGAGPIRNAQMLREGKPDTVLAFTEDLATSRGTQDMVRRAVRAGLPTKVIGGWNGSLMEGYEALAALETASGPGRG